MENSLHFFPPPLVTYSWSPVFGWSLPCIHFFFPPFLESFLVHPLSDGFAQFSNFWKTFSLLLCIPCFFAMLCLLLGTQTSFLVFYSPLPFCVFWWGLLSLSWLGSSYLLTYLSSPPLLTIFPLCMPLWIVSFFFRCFLPTLHCQRVFGFSPIDPISFLGCFFFPCHPTKFC